MRVRQVVWKERFAEKLLVKHGVTIEEAEDVLLHGPVYRKLARGRVKGQDLYAALGQTRDGRYLMVVFIDKGNCVALPISARDMEASERRYHERHR